MAAIAIEDLDESRTWVIPIGNERIFAIMTRNIRGEATYVDIGAVDDNGVVMTFNDRLCPCKKNLREVGRSQCRKCRLRANAKTKRYQRRRRAKERACTTESSSTPC